MQLKHSRENCSRGQRIIHIVKNFEEFLKTESEHFKELGAAICIIGSLIEGTIINKVDEGDSFLFFENLKPEHFQLAESPTNYKVTSEGKKALGSHFVDDSGYLDYLKFLEEHLNALNEFLKQATLPEGMSSNTKWKRCKDCGTTGDGEMDHLKHCNKCLPPVTFTKAGICWILEDNGIVVSIDLIPLLPCPEKNTAKMFDMVTGALVKGDLPNWLGYLKKFVRSDRLLPEALSSLQTPEEGYISMKLLHTRSDENAFIMRPGQVLRMGSLKDPKLRKTYCFLKALKALIEADITSYSIKKVLLLDEFIKLTLNANNSIELLFAALFHPHLRPYFGKSFYDENGQKWKIDFELTEGLKTLKKQGFQ